MSLLLPTLVRSVLGSVLSGMLVLPVILCVLFPTVLSSSLLPDEQRLLSKLFNEQQYDNSVRPVFNSSKNVEVRIGFTLVQIMDMDEKNQLLVLNAWLQMEWKDERVGWNVSEYHGLEVVRLPAKLFWLPDLVLYNNADDYTSGFMAINAMVGYDGTISWSPPVRLKSSCKVDITYFPFDHQVCSLKFGSWTYDKAQVDLINMSDEVELSKYVTNGEWVLTRKRVVRNEVVYPISPAIYPDVTVVLTIQRRVLYYVLNILLPCFWLNILSVLTFCLPPDAGEKITLSITLLLSFSVFMLLVAESMPPTSEFVPLIGIYLTVSMAIASISVILTVLVLKLHHCAPNQSRVPKWVRTIVLGYLAKVVQCTFITKTSCLRRRRSSRKYDDVDTHDPRDVQSKLLKEIEIMTSQRNGTRYKSTPSKYSSTLKSGLNDSKVNLELKTYSESEESSMADDDSILGRCHRDKTMDDILKYLKVLVVKSDAEDAETEIMDEWKQVALVVDRLFFWMFLLITVFSSVILLFIVPSFKNIEDQGL